MDLRPIFSALLRHKTMLALLVTVIALSCAVVSNSVFLLTLRLERLHMPSGFAEDRVIEINPDISRGDSDDAAKTRTRQALVAMRQIPNVRAATLSNLAPFDNSAGWGGHIAVTPEQVAANAGPMASLYAGEDFAQTLDVHLLAGRLLDSGSFIDFTAFRDHQIEPSQVDALVTQALAQRVWPDQNPLGKTFYFRGDRTLGTVVGVIAHLPRTWIGDDGGADYSVILPMRTTVNKSGYYYLLRADTPEHRGPVLRAAVDIVRKLDPHSVMMGKRPLEDARYEIFDKDQAMAWILIGLCITLLLVTGLGIVGLSSYWVQQRRRQIGVRRALGATRGDILRYFLSENFLLTSLGVVLGMALAYGLSMLLMHYYELPRLPLFYFPVGAAALWLTGLLAVFGPALRASMISPATAASS